MVNRNYLVYRHTHKHAPNGSLVFFFTGYVNEILLPNPVYHLHKCWSLTYELQTIEAARKSSVSGRMTRRCRRMPRWTCRKHHHMRTMDTLEGMFQLGRRPVYFLISHRLEANRPATASWRFGMAECEQRRVGSGRKGTLEPEWWF
jgi:hypothetical protein